MQKGLSTWLIRVGIISKSSEFFYFRNLSMKETSVVEEKQGPRIKETLMTLLLVCLAIKSKSNGIFSNKNYKKL